MKYVLQDNHPTSPKYWNAILKIWTTLDNATVFNQETKDLLKDYDGSIVSYRPQFTSFDEAAILVDTLRTDLLFPEEEMTMVDRFAEQHFLAALSHLDLAHRALKLAWMEQLCKR